MHRRSRVLRNPKWQLVLVELLFILAYALFIWRLGGLDGNREALAFDFLLFAAGLIFWPFFFSQFILPVKTPPQRFQAYIHLLRYLFGRHGPALRIENGRIIQSDGESRRKGPGVLLLDAASAAVLRTDVAYTRAVGPGLYFLNYDFRRKATEYVAGAISLQAQSRSIGPAEREDPFVVRQRNEKEDEFKARQERRWETSGLTRDGIEVIPNISVTFKLESQPGESGSGFGCNLISVWRAVTAEGVDPSLPVDDVRRQVSWEWLPGRLAADVWREYLRMFTLQELFQDSRLGKTAREVILEMTRQRLTQAKVTELNEFGQPTGRQVTSPEFTLLLRRGLRVSSVTIHRLRLPALVDEQLTRRWESSWLDRARHESSQLEAQRSYTREAGQRRAWMDYAMASSQFAAPGKETLIEPEAPQGNQLLKSLVEGTLALCVRDSRLHQRVSAEKTGLLDLLGWIQKRM
jgi:hypothetical protein